MLGSVAVAVHVFEGAGTPGLGLTGHDPFRVALEAEFAQAAYFGRRLAILMIHAADRSEEALPRWLPRLRRLLRPVDCAALYGGGTVEILLPETTLDTALELGRAAVERSEGEPPLLCGIALYPGAAATAEELVEVSLDASRRATPASPVQVASEGLGPSPRPERREARRPVRGRERRHARRAKHRREARAIGDPRAAAGRDGHRQGGDRAAPPRAERPRRRQLLVRQLRRHPRVARREHALRPREGRVHRRAAQQQGRVRGGRRRHRAPRRGRRAARGGAGRAPARARDEARCARRRDPRDSTSTCA